MKVQIVPVSQTVDSKYQVGEIEQAVVDKIAESLRENRENGKMGLEQIPSARLVDGVYELAFGRHRRAAFLQNLEAGDTFFESMPLIVSEMTDAEMFDALVVENWQRREITDIEKAELIHRWMGETGKTSEEAGQKFKMAGSSVRNLLRLLNLPLEAQAKVRSGEINTTAARAMLVVDKLMGEEGVVDVLQRMEDGDGSMESVGDVLAYQSKHLDLDDGWVKASPFPVKHLAPLTAKDIQSIAQIGEDKDAFAQLMTYVQAGMAVTDEAFPTFLPDGLERVRVLANPPACEACPLHAVLDGRHYCGFEACADRKDAAWKMQEADNVATATGIPLYQKSDGPHLPLDTYQHADKKLVEERHADLRLLLVTNRVWNNFDGITHKFLKVVAVGDLAEKRKKKAEKKAEKKEQTPARKEEPKEDLELLGRQNRLRSVFKNRFAWEVAARIFAPAFDGLTNLTVILELKDEFNPSYPLDVDDSLLNDAGVKKMKKAEGLNHARRMLAMGMIDRQNLDRDTSDKCIKKYGEEAVKLAKEWGVKLPKDWSTQVEKYQAEFDAARKDVIEKRKAEKE